MRKGSSAGRTSSGRRKHSFRWGATRQCRVEGRAWQGGMRHLEGGLGSKEKEPREVSPWLRGTEWRKLTMVVNLPSKACLSSSLPNGTAEAAAVVLSGPFYVSVIILSPTKNNLIPGRRKAWWY